jgi:hypothetical protein
MLVSTIVAAAKFGSWKDISNFLHIPLKKSCHYFCSTFERDANVSLL